MNIAFANFPSTSKAQLILERLGCSLQSRNSTHLVLSNQFFRLSETSATLIADSDFFVSSAISQKPHFQGFVSALNEAPFVLLSDSWEDQLAYTLPSVLLLLSLKTTNQKQQNEIVALAKQTDDLLQRFQMDLELATKVHHQLLPPSDLQIPGVSVTSKYLPASGLGGIISMSSNSRTKSISQCS